jgi:hypothetical protein
VRIANNSLSREGLGLSLCSSRFNSSIWAAAAMAGPVETPDWLSESLTASTALSSSSTFPTLRSGRFKTTISEIAALYADAVEYRALGFAD